MRRKWEEIKERYGEDPNLSATDLAYLGDVLQAAKELDPLALETTDWWGAVRALQGLLNKEEPPIKSAKKGDGWAKVRIPAELKLGLLGIIDRCAWEVRSGDGDIWNVRPKEASWSQPRTFLEPWLLDRASEAHHSDRYERLATWPAHSKYLDQAMLADAQRQVSELMATKSGPAIWSAITLSILTAPDEGFGENLAALYGAITGQFPRSSLWAVEVDPVLRSRLTLIRLLLASQDAPELLDPNRPFEGAPVSSGLAITEGLGISSVLNTALLARSPGVLGITGARNGGMIAVLFGQFEAGHVPVGPDSLLDLYRSSLLSTPIFSRGTYKRPHFDETQALIRWWCQRLNGVYNILLDPRNYIGNDDYYDPAAQYGDILSFDRLVSAVNGILIGSRQDQFVRRLLMFEALDILEGFRFGTYTSMLSRDQVASDLGSVRSTIPKTLRPFFIPRCEGALTALDTFRSGWNLHERISGTLLRVAADNGGVETIPLDQAAGRYIRLVRNGGHSLRRHMESAQDRSLFVSHTGSIPPELSDVAYLHFMRLILDPTLIKRGSTT